MKSTQRGRDHPEPDDCAEFFIRAVMLPGDLRAPMAKEPEMTDKQPMPPKSRGGQGSSMIRPTPRLGVQVRVVNGKFRGDYHEKEHAIAAAAVQKVSPR